MIELDEIECEEEIDFKCPKKDTVPMKLYPADIKDKIKTQLITDKRCSHILVKDMALILSIIDEVL
jgi:hypothetical protein